MAARLNVMARPGRLGPACSWDAGRMAARPSSDPSSTGPSSCYYLAVYRHVHVRPVTSASHVRPVTAASHVRPVTSASHVRPVTSASHVGQSRRPRQKRAPTVLSLVALGCSRPC
jgi:hypothetical protein